MKVYKLLLVLIISTLFFSCSRDEEVSGPKYATASGNLSIIDDKFRVLIDTDTSIVDFVAESVEFSNPDDKSAKDTVFFFAKMSEEVSWSIAIKGNSSGALKTLVGTSNSIDFPYWTGESDNIYFFRKGESVTATLSFVGSDVSKEYSFIVQETKSYPDMILIGDFEKGADGRGLVIGTADDPDGWFQYFDVEGDDEEISYGLGPNEIVVKQPSKQSIPVEAVQGEHYFQLRGDDNPTKAGSFFIGGMGHTPVSYGIGSDVLLEDIFMNLYLNSNGNTTTKFVIELGGINGDLFTKEMLIDWTGWRQISIRLSDFVQSQVGDNGIGKLLPEQLKSLKFAIHSAGTSGNVAEVNIDFVTLTFGSPFKQ